MCKMRWSPSNIRRTEPVFPPQTWPHMRSSYINPNVTFANAVKNDDPQNVNQLPPQQESNNSGKLEQVITKMMDKLDSMLTLLTTIVTKLFDGSKP